MNSHNFRSVLLCVLAAWTVCSAANAADGEFARQVWINPGIYSLHFDRDRNLRDDNIGLGAEVVLAPDHALLAGTYINGDWARTHYGAYAWRPLHWKLGGASVSAGVAVGAFDGYPRYRDGAWFVAPLPVVAIEGERFGVNLSVIPTIEGRVRGAVAVQLKLRVW